MFDCMNKVLVTANWQPKKWLENPRNKIFVVDEGEDAIEKRLLELTPAGFTGLAALRDRKTVLFTATLTNYFAACWQAVFQAAPAAIHKFPSQQEVRNGQVFK